MLANLSLLLTEIAVKVYITAGVIWSKTDAAIHSGKVITPSVTASTRPKVL